MLFVMSWWGGASQDAPEGSLAAILLDLAEPAIPLLPHQLITQPAPEGVLLRMS